MTTTSKNIDGVQELTLIAPLKSGVVECGGEPISHASRLRLLLNALFAQRKSETESALFDEGLLESLQILRFVRWALIDDAKLMLAVSFDGPWEPYIRKIVDQAGPVLDVIFCHCEDYAGSSCADGYPQFAAWVRKYQVDIPFIFASDADLTVDDVRYLKNYEKAQMSGQALFALETALYPASKAPLQRAYALFGLRAFFPDVGQNFTDQRYFDQVSAMIVAPDVPNLEASRAALYKAATAAGQAVPYGLREAAMIQWLETLKPLAVARAKSKIPAPLVARAPDARSSIQGNILTSYGVSNGDKGITHGCFALLRFKDKKRGAAFLARLKNLITPEPAQGDTKLPDITCNLALTFNGLRSLGLSQHELQLFPKEFQEGLESRAGLLGDVGLNHPEQWSLPRTNWPIGKTDGDTVPLTLVDAVLILQTSRPLDEGHELPENIRGFLTNLLKGGPPHPDREAEFEVLHVQASRRYNEAGHLGSKDGVSQPVAVGEPLGIMDKRDEVPLGELLLGYDNRLREPSTLPDELSKNSTFVAIRKMAQDPSTYDALRAKDQLDLALGRRADGKNLIDGTDSNAFGFAPNSDQQCPLFSHVRRANPRSPAPGAPNAPPRIMRRGMSYGPKHDPEAPVPGERGVMFLAIAASLADQYEVVQRWVNGGNSTGIMSSHPDLIAGTFPPGSERKLQYRTPQGIGTMALPPRPAAVLHWGLYAFIPSLTAIDSLVGHAAGGSYELPERVKAHVAPPVTKPPAQPASAEARTTFETKYSQNGAEPLTAKGLAAKAVFEDVFRQEGIEQNLRALLTKENNGMGKVEDYAVIAGARQVVEHMLTTPDVYSVRSYWHRMKACRATLYLGMDPNPKELPASLPDDGYTADVLADSYLKESKRANEFAASIRFDQAFHAAKRAATAWCEQQDAQYDAVSALLAAAPPAQRPDPAWDLQALGARVIRDVAVDLYGLPKTLLSDDLDLEWPAPRPAYAPPESALRCPIDLTSVFAHVFPPRPSAAISAQAAARGRSIESKVRTWHQDPANKSAVDESKLVQEIRDGKGPLAPNFEQRTIIGLLSGFAVPTFGSLMSVLQQLVKTDELWRLQRVMPSIEVENEGITDLLTNLEPITSVVYAKMIHAPVPSMIHRTVVAPDVFQLPPGELVALHLGVAASQAAQDPKVVTPWKLLFGDLPETQAQIDAKQQAKKDNLPRPGPVAVHACPGQSMAMGVIVGTVVALLNQKHLKKVPLDPLTLTKYSVPMPPEKSA